MNRFRLPASISLLPFLVSAAVSLPGTSIAAQDPVANGATDPQSRSGPIARFAFDGTIENTSGTSIRGMLGGEPSFAEGLDGQALSFGPGSPSAYLTFDPGNLPFARTRDFSVQFRMRTEAGPDRQFVLVSQKEFPDNSLASQKQPGWVFYASGGTWAWNMGSGSRRITYERDNGRHMPLNDGGWHQLTMTYSSERSEIRLFYDGVNWVSYHVSDSDGFDFTSTSPMVVGQAGRSMDQGSGILPAILTGEAQLQELVDAFNSFGLSEVEPEEFIHLIVDPRRLFRDKVEEAAVLKGADAPAFREAMAAVDWDPVAEAESALMSNPYTVHQVVNFMETAPLMKIYALVNGEVTIRRDTAEVFAEHERLYAPEFDMDDLAVWDRALSSGEVLSSYSDFFKPTGAAIEENLSSITAAAWNIWHGGKHWTVSEHGWDSRVAIAEMLQAEDVDVIMMQETYSSGDFIAAELGYYFATTVDWDYLNQGANISVLSRYPIEEVHVQEDSPFQNVGVKVTISRTQDLYVMSNWYGMDQFPAVFDYHEARFLESDSIPTLFAGDFNAVPHTDGGDSPASRALLEAGFTDAFRSLYPDVEKHPGASHRSGRRIDQLYYRGVGLKNTSTRVISTRPGGFPSDHFLILSTFDLDYVTTRGGR
ncbi:endonuclease/exonuclease/phosphatase family protein [Gemmatimonadota bacterium]